MRTTVLPCLLLGTLQTVSAHGYVREWLIANQSYTGYNPSAAPWVPEQNSIAWYSWNTDTGPVYGNVNNLTSPEIICSINATNSKLYATTVAAGDTIRLQWTKWPESHHGPVFDYLAACNGDCSEVNKEELEWFKIAEQGQIEYGAGLGKPGVWATDLMIADNNTWSVTIPSSIKAGNYVLRHEILALHSAHTPREAQFYPQCANIVITGDGDAEPAGVVGMELYPDEDHPGLHYNIWNDEEKPVYQMPGPKLVDLS